MDRAVETPLGIQGTVISLTSSNLKLIVVPDSEEMEHSEVGEINETCPSLTLPHQTIEFRFGKELKERLLGELFSAARRDDMVGEDPILLDIRKGKLAIIENLELYMQHVLSHIKSECLRETDVLEFADDAIAITNRLRTPFVQFGLPPTVDKNTLIDCLAYNMLVDRTSQQRQLPTQFDPHWHSYIRGMCDAIFGIWSAPKKGRYHPEVATLCIESFICSVNLEPRAPMDAIPPLEINLFDAAFVEAHGPFKFERTPNLSEHLLIKKNQIFIYSDWQKWGGIRRHSVLRDAGFDLTMFDHLLSIGRYGPTGRAMNNRSPICRLSIDVQLINLLLFFQDIPTIPDGLTQKKRF